LLQIFQEKTPAVMPMFGQNIVNSVKTTLNYELKKVLIFHEKLDNEILIFRFSKTHIFLMHESHVQDKRRIAGP